ncbi:MAG: MaoC/PaaZ C-terminal domain-containing protein [Microbacteriaceae bacterium]|nr:MaoC/PaaZ C-terminal domain-containing protein [Microbacteriaceae bacterium]
MAEPIFESLNVGDVVAEKQLQFSRDSLVRYAGASGDFNPIHYREDVAVSVGLEGVLAHGMLTMGAAVSPVSEWLGAAGFIADAQARFTRPIVVPAEGTAQVDVKAAVAKIDAENRSAQLNLTVVHAEKTVLAKALVEVKFFPAK